MAELRAIDAEPPGKDVVKHLEHLLEAARKGDLSAVASAVVYRDGSTGNGWSALPSKAAMIGSIEVLKADIVTEIIEGRG